MPDVAVLTLGSTNENSVAATAVANNAIQAQAIIAELHKEDIDPADIRTVNASLSPIMEEETNPKAPNTIKRTIVGYRASTSFAVKIHRLDRVGPIVSHIVERGANDYRGLMFLVTDEDAKYDKLRALAVENAMHRATLYAHGASMKLGRLLAIDPDGDRSDVGVADLPVIRAVRAAPDAVPLPVAPGTQELTVRVAVTWELVPE